MNMNDLRAAASPFSLYLKLLLVALLFGSGLYAGIKWTTNHYEAVVATKNGALRAAALQLQTAANALRQQDANNKQAIADAKAQADSAKDASKVASRAQRQAEKRLSDYKAQVTSASKKHDCDVLLHSDIAKVCGL